MRGLAVAIALLVAGTAAAEPVAELQLAERDTPHVGVPFVLAMIVDGFEEQPAPSVAKLEIAGASVTFMGAEPSVQRSYQNINGRVTNSVRVRWVLRWSIEPHKEGRLHIPSITATQGALKATAQGGDPSVDSVPTTDSMKLALALPARPIFVGETVPVTLTWLFRTSPSEDPKWSIPLMAIDAFTVSAPPADPKAKRIAFHAGTKDLELPYEVDETDDGGVKYRRLTTTFFIAPRTAGKLEVPASSVVAPLPVGRPDFFGNAASKLFRAMDSARTLEVKPLPQTDRPASFAGAVGDQFSIDVTTSRSVVKLGEPVELAIRIKSNQRLDTLALGRLDGEGGLPKDKFQVGSDPPTGELSDDGKTKTFKVTAQVTGAANAVPAIAFAYFDPVKSVYQTIHSEPIALSVAGGSVVSASDVVAARPKPGVTAAPEMENALVDAELALSAPGQEDERPLGGTALWILVGLLYAVPVALFAARRWQLRTAGQREDAAEVKAARKKVEELLDRAGSTPAREVAGPLAAALRELARLAGQASSDDGGLLAKLETESFSQGASTVPLSADLRSDAAGLLRKWTTAARSKRVPAAAALLVLLVAGRADAADSALAEGRAAYQEAMQLTSNPTARKAAFARAARELGEAARAAPDHPELLADWGNAALGAGDVATATLAYRRALAIDGGNLRARHNLAWLRSRQAVTFRPSAAGATDTLLFFQRWTRARKLVIGGAAFAIGMLLLVPWAGRRRKGLAGLAILPFAVWLAMLASVVLEDRHPDDAVVMDDVVLRAADSAGAPAALTAPLPRGVEVTVVERREAWMKIRLASGAAGWVPTGAVERIAR